MSQERQFSKQLFSRVKLIAIRILFPFVSWHFDGFDQILKYHFCISDLIANFIPQQICLVLWYT